MEHKYNDHLFNLLEQKYETYCKSAFVDNDPISIPHQYSSLQDIEITAFWTAIFSWGQRKTIINKSRDLFARMDHKPYDFILNHSDKDLKVFKTFKHRTFNYYDTLCFIQFFRNHYENNNSLESAFLKNGKFENVEESLNNFRKYFFTITEHLQRTKKHVTSPARKSTCKRLNMFLRWMVRSNDNNVDFGLWKNIPTSELKIPFDVHVERVAKKLDLLHRKQRY